MNKTRRTKAGLGFLIVAVSLAVGSVAYACTVYKGQMSIAQSGQTTRTNFGDNVGMGYCSGTTPQTMTLSRSASYTVTVAASDGDCESQLQASSLTRIYEVYKTSDTTDPDCMGGLGNMVSGISVDSNGDGSASPAGSTLDVGTTALCVSDILASQGMQMAVTTVA